jgi:hypothetical protein
MAIRRSTAPFLFSLFAALGCGGTPSTDASAPGAGAPAAAEAPAAGTPTSEETPSAETPASGESAGSAPASEEKWAGEEEAVAKTPVARTADEKRTTAVIQETIIANRQPVRDCYDKGRKELPDLKGTMTIEIVLDPDGNVRSAKLNAEKSDIKSPAVVSCSVDALKKIKFPPSSRGMETTVNYPFDFRPDGGGSKKKQ